MEVALCPLSEKSADSPFGSWQFPQRVTGDDASSRKPQIVLTGWSLLPACKTILSLKILGKCNPLHVPTKRRIEKSSKVCMIEESKRHWKRLPKLSIDKNLVKQIL